VITVLDDFVDQDIQDKLLDYVTDARLPFFLNEKTVAESDTVSDANTKDSLQLTHTFVADGVPNPSWDHFVILWYQFIKRTGINKPIQRAKANITFPLKGFEGTYSGAHVDHLHHGGVSAIYYMNDSDGDTIFFDKPGIGVLKQKARVSPKKGRLVYFDSSVLHSGQLPSKSEFRCVVNLNVYNIGEMNG